MKKFYKLLFFVFLFKSEVLTYSQIQLITNGDFEHVGSWVTSGNFYYGLPYLQCGSNGTTKYSFGGTNSSGVGINNAFGSISQTFYSFPSNTGNANLSFNLSISSDESVGNNKYDFLYVRLYSGSYPLATLAIYSNVDAPIYYPYNRYYRATNNPNIECAPYAYKNIVIPSQYLSGYSNLKLVFEATSDPGKPTIFRVDNVSLIANTYSPEITVTQNGYNVNDGATLNMTSSLNVGTTYNLIFNIINQGNSTLSLSYFNDNSSMVSITPPSNLNISPSNQTSFTIVFTPTSVGNFSTYFDIGNNDGNENPFNFVINWTAVTPTLPEVNVTYNGTNVPDQGTLNLGNLIIGNSYGHTFIASNIGNANLSLGAVSTTNQSFISQQLPNNLASGNNAYFSLTVNPNSVGNHSTTVSFPNNDNDENPYNFNLTWTASYPTPNTITEYCISPSTGFAGETSFNFRAKVNTGNLGVTSVQAIFSDAMNFPINLTYNTSTGFYEASKILQQPGNRSYRYKLTTTSGQILYSNFCNLAISKKNYDKQVTGNSLQHQTIDGDPFFTGTGNLIHSEKQLSLWGVNGENNIDLTYNSGLTNYEGGFGYGWFSLIDMKVDYSNSELWKVILENGQASYHAVYDFGKTSTQVKGQRDTLFKDISGNYIFKKQSGLTYAFRTDGKITSISDRNNNLIQFNYSGSYCISMIIPGGRSYNINWNTSINRIISISNGLQSVNYTYNPSRELITSSWNNGSSIQYTYTGNHYLTTLKDPKSITYLVNTYDALGRILTQKDANNTTTTISYNNPTLNATTVNIGGRTHIWYHDDRMRTIRNTDELGHSIEMFYNDDNDLISIKDKNGNITNITNNILSGLPTQIMDANLNTVKVSYDSNYLPIKYEDEMGNSTSITRDVKGNPTIIQTANGGTYVNTFFTNGLLSNSKNPNNQINAYLYNSFGDLINITLPNNAKYTLTYDAIGRVISLKDPNNKTWAITYNIFNQITKIVYPDGFSTEYQYDLSGNLIKEKDRQNLWTNYEYDLKDRLNKIIYSNNTSTRYNYNIWDQVLSIIDPRNVTVLSRVFNNRGDIISETTPLGTTSFTSDKNGNIIKMIDEVGATYDITYNKLDLPIKVFNSLIGETAFEYNKSGLLTKEVRSDGSQTSYFYNNMNWLYSIKDNVSGTNLIEYDLIGNKKKVIDANGHGRIVDYNNLNLPIKISYADGTFETKAYDTIGNLVSEMDRNNVLIKYGLDPIYRITSISYNNSNVESFNLSPNGWLMSASNNNGTLEFNRDSMGWVKTRTYNGKTTTYNRNEIGQVIGIIYPNNSKVDYIRNNAGLETQVKYNGNILANLSWLSGGRLSGISYSNGCTQTNTYNAVGNIISSINRLPDNSILNGNILTRNNIQFPVDDSIMTRLQPNIEDIDLSNSFNDDDKQLNLGSNALSHSSSGQLINGVNTTHTWNTNGTWSGFQTTGLNMSFTRDALNNVVKETTNGYTKSFQNDDEICGIRRTLQEYDQMGNTLESFIYVLGSPLARDSASNIQFYHGNIHGDVVGLTNLSGKVTDLYASDIFGSSIAHLGTSSQPFQSRGMMGIKYLGNGLYDNMARGYDANLKRFISQDPLGSDPLNTQSMQRYRYGYNSPLYFTDPTGLKENVSVVTESEFNIDETYDFLKSGIHALNGSFRLGYNKSNPLNYLGDIKLTSWSNTYGIEKNLTNLGRKNNGGLQSEISLLWTKTSPYRKTVIKNADHLNKSLNTLDYIKTGGELYYACENDLQSTTCVDQGIKTAQNAFCDVISNKLGIMAASSETVATAGYGIVIAPVVYFGTERATNRICNEAINYIDKKTNFKTKLSNFISLKLKSL